MISSEKYFISSGIDQEKTKKDYSIFYFLVRWFCDEVLYKWYQSMQN